MITKMEWSRQPIQPIDDWQRVSHGIPTQRVWFTVCRCMWVHVCIHQIFIHPITRYARPISPMTDGSVIQCDTPRTSPLRTHLLYADKIKHQGVLGIDMTAPLGLYFLSMPLYGGRRSEKRHIQVLNLTMTQTLTLILISVYTGVFKSSGWILR